MTDIQRRDRQLFIKELLRPSRLGGELSFLAFCFLLGWNISHTTTWIVLSLMVLASLGIYAQLAYKESCRRRFVNKRFEALWLGCLDRLKRFREVFSKMQQDLTADLKQMPKTVESVAKSLYASLRRADMVSNEIEQTERGIYAQPPAWASSSSDAQATELYRIADRNIAEYRQLYDSVMAGVMRTEAQSAVFMTTLDTLRVKMLGYRFVGKSPEVPSQDFLEALGEARIQLDAIDKALEELDFSLLPKMVAVVDRANPPTETEAQQTVSNDRPE